MERLSLEGRSIVVFGGSSGIGRKIAYESAKAGATVYIGTRSPDNFNKGIQQLGRTAKREGIDLSTLLPFLPLVADVRDKTQLDRSVKDIQEQGANVTDVVFSQASGMNQFVKSLFDNYIYGITDLMHGIPIDELPPTTKEIVENKLATMRKELAVWNQEALPDAMAVNYRGTFDAIDVISSKCSHGFRAIYLNSTWGDQGGGPLMYQVVEQSKMAARDRFKTEGPQLAQMDIPTAIVIASLVTDTNVGKMFRDFFFNLMDQDQRKAVADSSITTADVWTAAKNILLSDPTHWSSYPFNIYISRINGFPTIGNSVEPSAMYTRPYRF